MSSPSADRREDVTDLFLEHMAARLAAHRFSQAARLFHRASSFGHFEEPPRAAAEVSGTLSDLPLFPATSAGATELPPGLAELDLRLGEAIERRVSQREFGERPLPLRHLALILHAGYGAVPLSAGAPRRTVPSAGALYPLRLVVLSNAVEGLARGVHVFSPTDRCLWSHPTAQQPAAPGDWFRTRHVDYHRAAAAIFVVGRLDAPCVKYGERGYRYILLEAGHVGQNICLAASALAVPHVPVGGFDDEVVNRGLELAASEFTVYSVVLGQL